jgi:hypothetical protein
VPTDDEIERRVTTDDTPITARRVAVAQKAHDLGTRIVAVSDELQNLTEQMRQLIGDNDEIVTIEKLATYTDIPKEKLDEWAPDYNPTGKKRKRTPRAEVNAERLASRNKRHDLSRPDDRASVVKAIAVTQDVPATMRNHVEPTQAKT